MNNSFLNPEQWTYKYCPSNREESIDWGSVFNAHIWVREMEGVPQDPIFHAEGDVLRHTQNVCEALVSLDEWLQLEQTEQSIVFLAALLHDVGKPICTSEEDGVIKSRGHARKGELISRGILYRGHKFEKAIPISIREKIAKLVRFHGLPLSLMDKENPEKQITVVSQMINLDWLAMLSKADVLGRISKDRNELLEKIELFKEYCEENQCYEKPKKFPDSFSRFFYFRKENGYAGYKAYDNTTFEVIVMSGLPASGKDTWIKNNNKGMPIICLDDIRAEIRIDPEDDQGRVIQYAKEMAKKYMRKKNSFIWNATNVTKMIREQLVDLFVSYGAKVKIVYIEAPYQEIIKRNSDRDKPVPEKIIEKLIDKLEVPDVTEAHEVLWVINK